MNTLQASIVLATVIQPPAIVPPLAAGYVRILLDVSAYGKRVSTNDAEVHYVDNDFPSITTSVELVREKLRFDETYKDLESGITFASKDFPVSYDTIYEVVSAKGALTPQSLSSRFRALPDPAYPNKPRLLSQLLKNHELGTHTLQTTETTIAHGMSYAPKIIEVEPGTARWEQTKPADLTNIYLKTTASVAVEVRVGVR